MSWFAKLVISLASTAIAIASFRHGKGIEEFEYAPRLQIAVRYAEVHLWRAYQLLVEAGSTDHVADQNSNPDPGLHLTRIIESNRVLLSMVSYLDGESRRFDQVV